MCLAVKKEVKVQVETVNNKENKCDTNLSMRVSSAGRGVQVAWTSGIKLACFSLFPSEYFFMCGISNTAVLKIDLQCISQENTSNQVNGN